MKILGADPLVWILRIGLCYVVNLLPRSVLDKDRLRITAVLDFISLLAVMSVAGLIFALPFALVLTIFHMWVRAIGNRPTSTNRILFIVTLVACAVFTAAQLIHLPIRIALHQPSLNMAANVAGLFWAIAMTGNVIEFGHLKQIWGQKSGTAEQGPSDEPF